MSGILQIVMIVMLLGTAIEALTFTTTEQNFTELEGSNVIFECALDEIRKGFNIYWLGKELLSFNDVVNTQDENIKIYPRQDGKGYDLELVRIRVADEGMYVCETNTKPKLSQRNFLSVIIDPKITLSADQLERKVNLGEDVILDCQATGRPLPDIVWTKLSGKLPDGSLQYSGKELIIEKIKKTDAGEYECRATNMGGHITEIIEVQVMYKPSVTVTVDEVYSGPGYDTEIACAFSASPTAEISWEKDGVNVEDKTNVRVEKSVEGLNDVNILKFSPLTKEDFGIYKCIGENDLGVARGVVELKAIPDKVKLLSTAKNAYSSEFPLKWMVISYDSPLDFDLQFREVNGTYTGKWANATIPVDEPGNIEHKQEYRIKGLQPHFTYQLQIRARNSFGYGKFSDLLTFKTAPDGYGGSASCSLPGVLVSLVAVMLAVIFSSA